jgi:hypothetical protein
MIERVAEAQTLKDEPRSLPDEFRKSRFPLAEGLIVKAREMITESVSDYRCRVKHRGVLKAAEWFRRDTITRVRPYAFSCCVEETTAADPALGVPQPGLD